MSNFYRLMKGEAEPRVVSRGEVASAVRPFVKPKDITDVISRIVEGEVFRTRDSAYWYGSAEDRHAAVAKAEGRG